MNLLHRIKANALIAGLQLKTSDQEVFDVLQSIAQTDAAFAANKAAAAMVGVPVSREAEDIIERSLKGYIGDRTKAFRRDGADESATTAYGLAFILAFDDASKEVAARYDSVPAKTPSGLLATHAPR